MAAELLTLDFNGHPVSGGISAISGQVRQLRVDETTNALQVSILNGAMATSQSGAWTVGINALPSLPTGANNIGNVGVSALPSLPTGANTIGAVNQGGSWNVGLNAGNQVIGSVSQNGVWTMTVAGLSTMRIWDGTNTAAVKPASTAPVAADPALVVSISPNTPALTVQGYKSSNTTGNITTASTTVGPMAVPNTGALTVSLTGTYAGVNISFFASSDGGATWYATAGTRTDTGVCEITTGALTNTLRAWDFLCGGATHFKVVSTAWTSGTGAVQINPHAFAVDPSPAAIAQGPVASGTAVTGNPVLVGGSDGTYVRNLAVNASGQLQVVFPSAQAVTLAALPALAAGAAVIGGVTQSGTWNIGTITTLPALPTGANTIGIVNQGTAATLANAWSMKITDATNGPAAVKPSASAPANADAALVVSLSPNMAVTSQYSVLAAATTNAASVKASYGRIFSLSLINSAASTRYVRLYNLATAPTVGTSTPYMVIAIPATSSKELEFGTFGLYFGTGIGIAITGAATDLDATAVTAGDVRVLMNYI